MADVDSDVLIDLLNKCEEAISRHDFPGKALKNARDRIVQATELKALRQSGLTWVEIADQLGRPSTTLQEAMPRAVWIAEWELAKLDGSGSVEDRDRRIVDYVVRQWHSYEEATKEFGLSISRIGYIVRAANHPSARGPGRPKKDGSPTKRNGKNPRPASLRSTQ